MDNLFKITGIILSFISCTVIGLYHTNQLKRRKLLLSEIQNLMQQISTEIGYFKEPLPLIFQRIHERNHPIHQAHPTTIFLRQCIRPNTENQNFEEIWKTAIQTTYQDEPLNADDIRIMNRYGAFLGQSDFQSQKGHFALLEGELQKQIREAEENIRTKGSLYSKAGASIGAIIAIAFL